MNTKIATYALIKALYDENKDYIDTFVPLVMRVITKESYSTTENIQQKLKARFSIEIPLLVLKTILKRAKNSGHLKQKTNTSSYSLSESGNILLKDQPDEKDIEREITQLAKTGAEFLQKNDISLSIADMKALMFDFIDQNFQEMVLYFNPQKTLVVKDNKESKETDRVLVNFLQEIDESNPELYETFKKMVYGSLILSTLYLPDSAQREHIYKQDLDGLILYLDTNILFSFFGFHEKEQNKSAIELIDLLKGMGVKIKVCDFTVQEVVNHLGSYSEEESKYIPEFRVNTIYSALKTMGWNKMELESFISTIQETIEFKGIEIDYDTSFKKDLKEYKPKNEKLDALFAKYKPDQPLPSRRHDQLAIEHIRELRKKRSYNIKDAKYFFLTSDVALHRIAYEGLAHKDKRTIPEVFLDRILASLIWFKNSKNDLPIKSIIAIHAKGLLINRNVWSKFFNNIDKLEEEKKITAESIATVFFSKQAKEALRTANTSDVTKDFTLNLVNNAVTALKEKEGEKKRKNDLLEKERTQIEESLNRARASKEKIVNNNAKIKAGERLRLTKKVSNYFDRIWIPALLILLASIMSVLRAIWIILEVLQLKGEFGKLMYACYATIFLSTLWQYIKLIFKKKVIRKYILGKILN